MKHYIKGNRSLSTGDQDPKCVWSLAWQDGSIVLRLTIDKVNFRQDVLSIENAIKPNIRLIDLSTEAKHILSNQNNKIKIQEGTKEQ